MATSLADPDGGTRVVQLPRGGPEWSSSTTTHLHDHDNIFHIIVQLLVDHVGFLVDEHPNLLVVHLEQQFQLVLKHNELVVLALEQHQQQRLFVHVHDGIAANMGQ